MLETECGLIVVGQAIPHLSALLDGFSELLADGACPVTAEVTGICSHDYQNTAHPFQDRCGVSHSENLVVLSSNVLFEEYTTMASTLHIRLNSPLRLSENGRLLVGFDFSRFARSLMRRVSSLAYYYGACEFDCDFRELSRQAEEVVCKEDRFSAAVGQNRKLSGVIGYGSFCGEFSGLMPFLVAGQYVHAGKGASFGMGCYELITGVQ
ncbi:MAG: CRISPR system precrRNA processing endoribonuclease RAMP protein Cas6 [Geobacteraceae bacterium]|nr:CRISPR system precrRNA processing endoribonuclease RAMP protein Cas6 [Geobacteraceae bacterium]